MIRLLVVDDSALVRRLFGQIFADEGDFDVRFARDGEEALEIAKAFEPQVVTLDIQMPNMDGLACLDRLMIETPRPVVMVSSLTGAGAEATLSAMELGAFDFIGKPRGPVALNADGFRAELVEKVRAAAGARLRRSLRLRERVRHRIGAVRATPAQAMPAKTKGRAIAESTLPGVVLIGTSTGGPPALEAVLSSLPGDFPWAVLIAQHMPATFTGPMARRLDRVAALEVVEVTQPMPLVGGRVYVGRGDADIIVAARPGGPIAMPIPARADYPWHPSADRLVTTALDHIEPQRLVGVLMTGMGRDGAAAMTRLRALGGRTIAEAESTAAVWGMPGELVKAGGAEVVAPLDEIADHILQMVS